MAPYALRTRTQRAEFESLLVCFSPSDGKEWTRLLVPFLRSAIDSSILAILRLRPEKSFLIASSFSNSLMFLFDLRRSKLAVRLLQSWSFSTPSLALTIDNVFSASRVAGSILCNCISWHWMDEISVVLELASIVLTSMGVLRASKWSVASKSLVGSIARLCDSRPTMVKKRISIGKRW